MSIIKLRMIMVIIVMKSLLVSRLLLQAGVKHALDISKKFFQVNQVEVSVSIDLLFDHLH